MCSFTLIMTLNALSVKLNTHWCFLQFFHCRPKKISSDRRSDNIDVSEVPNWPYEILCSTFVKTFETFKILGPSKSVHFFWRNSCFDPYRPNEYTKNIVVKLWISTISNHLPQSKISNSYKSRQNYAEHVCRDSYTHIQIVSYVDTGTVSLHWTRW